jgi:hypothetical protein
VALSRRNEGILWTHADAGPPRLLAVSSRDGAVRGSVRIAGALVEDWEDVAVGRCAAGSCVYLADIGDNRANRARITVYRIPEPLSSDSASAPADAIHATYPDGPHDAEALFVDPAGRIYLVTKGERGSSAIYRYPESPLPGSESRLEMVRMLSRVPLDRSARVTGATASANGRWVALRTLQSVSFHPLTVLTGGAAGEPVVFDLRLAREAQGEGVALGDSGALYLASEGGRKRDPATLTRLVCPLPD